MAVCKICRKKNMAGRKIRHKHTGLWERKAPRKIRQFKVNIQKRVLLFNNQKLRTAVCTKCLKRIKKDGSYKNFQIPPYPRKNEKRDIPG